MTNNDDTKDDEGYLDDIPMLSRETAKEVLEALKKAQWMEIPIGPAE